MPIFDTEFRLKIASIRSKIIVFGMMRNENIRLNSWILHYRAIGCTDFVVIDNGSTDGTYEFLKDQADVVVVQTSASFGQAKYGVDWLNEFRDIIGPDRWVLFADADELLVYPGWPERPVDDLAREIESAGCNALWAFLLDMYPNGPIDPVDPPSDADVFTLAPCFDSKYYFRYPPKKPWQQDYPSLEVIGGPRVRSLSTVKRELKVTWVDRFLRGQLDRVLPHLPDYFLPFIFRLLPQAMPSLFKSPLVRTSRHIWYLNNHDLMGAKYFERNAVMCHFKFLGDFSKKVHTEISRKEHYRKGAEYFRYRDILNKNHMLDFRCPTTTVFMSVEQLVELGLFIESQVTNPKASTV